MKKRVLIDISVVADLPRWVGLFARTEEDIAKQAERWVEEFNEFIRDHRSQDEVQLEIKREYEEICEFCGYEWESTYDTEGPCCCQKAIEEWEEQTGKKVSA